MNKEEKPTAITAEDVFTSSSRAGGGGTTQMPRDEDACYKNCTNAGGDREKCFKLCYKDW